MESVFFRTRFWRSSYVRRAKPNTKYIYSYLITNEHTKPSGIYKFYLSDIKEETGLIQKQISVALQILSEAQKIMIKDDWIFVSQFLQETFDLSKNSLSGTIKNSIEKQFVSDNIPVELIACFDYIYNTLQIPYPYPTDTLAQYIKTLDWRFKTRDLRLENYTCADFETFWEAYPKKKNKGTAEKAWKKIKPNEALLQTMLSKIKEAIICEDWIKNGGQFIPYPATWLNGKCWHDDYDQRKTNTKLLSKAQQRTANNLAVAQAAIRDGLSG
jgi:hypothetical protein